MAARDVFTSSTTWVAPQGVTAVLVECWGAGGSGAGFLNNGGNAATGGGGGAYARLNAYTVVPGNTYTVTVGVGGTAVGGSSTAVNGIAGGDSWFDTALTVLAKGGGGGIQPSLNTANGGNSASCIGDVKFSGGSSSTVAAGANGGGGGAGDANNGGSTSNGTAGTGGSVGGGNGGSGGAAGGAGTALGGAGGAGSTSPSGAGARGQVQLSYQAAFVLSFSEASHSTDTISSILATYHLSFSEVAHSLDVLKRVALGWKTLTRSISNWINQNRS